MSTKSNNNNNTSEVYDELVENSERKRYLELAYTHVHGANESRSNYPTSVDLKKKKRRQDLPIIAPSDLAENQKEHR